MHGWCSDWVTSCYVTGSGFDSCTVQKLIVAFSKKNKMTK